MAENSSKNNQVTTSGVMKFVRSQPDNTPQNWPWVKNEVGNKDTGVDKECKNMSLRE